MCAHACTQFWLGPCLQGVHTGSRIPVLGPTLLSCLCPRWGGAEGRPPKNGSCGTWWPRSAPRSAWTPCRVRAPPLWFQDLRLEGLSASVAKGPLRCPGRGLRLSLHFHPVLWATRTRNPLRLPPGLPLLRRRGSVWGPRSRGPQAGSSVSQGWVALSGLVLGSSVSPPASSVLIGDKAKTRQSPRSQRVGVGRVLRGRPVGPWPVGRWLLSANPG